MRLKDIFSYNHVNGLLTWNVSTSKKIKIGSIAGCVSDGYVRIRYKGERLLAHRVAWEIYYGYKPNVIDHINGDKSDNRIENLRDVKPKDNSRNQKVKVTNKSGAQGVYYRKDKGKWMAQIGDNGKNVYLGYHDTKESAIRAREKAVIDLNYHPNHGKR